MLKRLFPTTVLAIILMVAGCSDHGDPVTGPADPGGPDPVSFATAVQPIFDANCLGCHGAGGNAGLDLRSSVSHANLVGVAAVNSTGNLVEAGDSTASVLLQRLQGTGGQMPPAGPLSLADLETVTTWIDEGASDN